MNLVENLLLFNETKELSKCQLVDNWKENKFQIKLTSKKWNKFLNFLRKSNVHLFLRIINLNLKIIINEIIKEEEFDDDFDDDFKEQLNELKQEKFEQSNNMNLDSTFTTEFKPSNDSTSQITLASLNECINKINSQPSRINGMCCYHLEDHQDCITSVNISPDTEMISVSNENSTIYLYKLSENTTTSRNSNKQQKKVHIENKPNYQELIGGHSSTVFKSKFTHDSKYLLSCGDDNIVCLWNVNKTKEILENNQQEEQENEEEEDLFDSKLKNLWSNNRIKPVATSLVTSYSGHLYSVWDLELYSQLNLFTTASKDSTARLWSFDRIYPLRIFAGHQSDVNCVKFHPNGAYIATGSSDKTVRLWSVASGDFVRLFSGHRSRVYSLAFSPDGTYLASSGEDKKIKVYDLRSGLVYKEFKGHSDTVHALTFDNNSEILCSGSLDRTVKFWDFHQKNIKIGPDTSALNSSGNSGNNSQNSSCEINKNLSSPSTSNELIRSLNVDFSVYSIYCDMQNVFYVNGAKKMTNTTTTTSQNVNRNLIVDEKPILIDRKLVKPAGEKSIPKQNNSDLNNSSKKIVAKSKTLPGEKKTLIAANQSVEATPKSSISTRSSRRNASESQNNTPTSTTTATTQANTSSFLFSNDDDLYEV